MKKYRFAIIEISVEKSNIKISLDKNIIIVNFISYKLIKILQAHISQCCQLTYFCTVLSGLKEVMII